MEPNNPLRSLVRAYGLIQLRMQPYFAKFGISTSQWGVLRTLARLEKEDVQVTLSDLSEHLLIQPPSVTGVVDRMEKAGLLQREVDPRDKRSRLVCLTALGRQLLKAAQKDHPAKMASLLQPLTKTEQKELQRLLEKLAVHIEKESAHE